MSTLSIPDEMLRAICSHAEADYPAECCGIIVAPRDNPDALSRARPCRNVQDLYHARAPEQFTRTAKTAYFIDPVELLTIEKELRASNELTRVIYHSHTDVDAYFSEEDVRAAVADGEPIHPGVDYLVLSVKGRRTVDHKLFTWNRSQSKFLE